MADPPRYRELVETEEFSAQHDEIVARYSLDVIGPVLNGLYWGIAENPRAYSRTVGKIYLARSRQVGLTVPVFTIFFSIENEGREDEMVLLLWIEEANAIEDMGYSA
jgi:hypothetical protein